MINVGAYFCRIDVKGGRQGRVRGGGGVPGQVLKSAALHRPHFGARQDGACASPMNERTVRDGTCKNKTVCLKRSTRLKIGLLPWVNSPWEMMLSQPIFTGSLPNKINMFLDVIIKKCVLLNRRNSLEVDFRKTRS
ncbi:hypothetical protein TNCV_3111511 [Trichonephila clavipes]|nr:hypothetical protein TNCV_3111511 [Trichonephila clavipes]